MLPDPEATPEPTEPEDVSQPEGEDVLQEEARVGSTPRGIAANAVLLALSRAARSFLLYEPSNEAIRAFLENLKRASGAFLEAYGELELDVRPFELVHNSEIVYLDRDRERSLAFRLYRDGIRKITISQGLEWHELLKLLEVVSIRYVGVRQTEDDLVVLLWKAGFTHINFEAVEGFVAETDDEVTQMEGGTVAQGEGPVISAPPDFDLPVPVRPQMVRVHYREVPQPALDELLAEDDTRAVPELAVRLCEELLGVLSDPNEPLRFADIASHLSETREFLFAEGLLGNTVRLAYAAASAHLADEESDRAATEFLQSFVTPAALGRFLRSVSRDATDAPPELYSLLTALPGDHLAALVEVLSSEQGDASRRVCRRLIERYVAARGDDIVKYIIDAKPNLACELLRVLRYADIDRTREAAKGLLERGELEIQLELLYSIEPMPTDAESSRMLMKLAGADNEEVRFRALKQLSDRRASAAYPPLVAKLKRDAPLRMTDREAEVLGETLAAVDPGNAMVQFREWCKPRGIFGGVLPGLSRLQRAAVAGLVTMKGEESEQLIRAVAEKAGSELQAYCTQAMIRRRRAARGGTQ